MIECQRRLVEVTETRLASEEKFFRQMLEHQIQVREQLEIPSRDAVKRVRKNELCRTVKEIFLNDSGHCNVRVPSSPRALTQFVRDNIISARAP